MLKELRRRIEETQYRSALGFYKERPRDRMVLEVKDDGSSLYLEIPTHLRNRVEIVVGSRLKGRLRYLYRRGGREKIKIDEPFDWEVVGYWNELHIPPSEASRLGLQRGDYVELVAEKIVNYGQEEGL
ncbi:TPA: hypothetical protein EYP84_04035 [Candidatus Bipolaricaulota bacterium]|nr:hypothetical protein [Candidatus Bipolaricaulota bacterium]